MLCVEGLASLLESRYDLSNVRCQLIKGTIRDTYLVRSSGGRYILSIYRANQRSVEEIHAELDVMNFLHDHGLAVAPVIPTSSGARLLAIQAPEGLRHAVLFSYVEGTLVKHLPTFGPARQYGQAIGRLHTLADQLPRSLPRPRIGFAQMVEGPLEALASVMIHRPDDLDYLRGVATWLGSSLDTLQADPPFYGLVHGDVIPSNAIVGPDGVLTLLDFDFCGYGWRVYDVATFLSEVSFWKAPREVADRFLEGYEAIRPLAEWERAAIPLFEVARNIFSLGVPAMNVNEWGSAYLSDRMIDILLGNIRLTMAVPG